MLHVADLERSIAFYTGVLGMRVLRRSRPHVASVMGLAYLADLYHADWTDAPLTALGIQPRGVQAYAEAVLRAAAE